MAYQKQFELVKKYQHRAQAIKALDAEIESVYGHVPSPGFGCQFKTQHGKESPTERKLQKIEKLQKKKAELEDLQEQCEDFVLSLDDYKIATILRLHYIMGYTWESTACEMNQAAYQHLIRTVNKFFSDETIEKTTAGEEAAPCS